MIITIEQLKKYNVDGLLGNIEFFKRTSSEIKKIELCAFINTIISMTLRLIYADSIPTTDKKENLLEMLSILVTYCGVMYRCSEAHLDDNEVMSNAEEVTWMGCEPAFTVEAILSRIQDEEFNAVLEDLTELKKIIGSNALNKFIYKKEN